MTTNHPAWGTKDGKGSFISALPYSIPPGVPSLVLAAASSPARAPALAPDPLGALTRAYRGPPSGPSPLCLDTGARARGPLPGGLPPLMGSVPGTPFL